MIGCISTSLNVVNIAVLFLASNKRSAIRLRKRVIGTRFSLRAEYAMVLTVVSAGLGAAARFAITASTSSRVIRPPTPVPFTSEA